MNPAHISGIIIFIACISKHGGFVISKQYNSHLLDISKLTRAATAITDIIYSKRLNNESVNVSSSRAEGGTANTEQPEGN